MGRQFLPVLVMSLVLISWGCGEGSKSGVPANSKTNDKPLSPNLTLSQFTSNGCLNLQKLSEYMSQPAFKFPARVTTYDYSAERDADTLFIRNFGMREIQIESLPFLKNVKQDKCATVTSDTAYGKPIQYEVSVIDSYSIRLDRMPSENSENTNDVVREAFEKESKIKSLEIRLAAPSEISITVNGEGIRTRCAGAGTFSYSKTSVYRWAGARSELPESESVSQANFNQMLRYIPSNSISTLPNREIVRENRPMPPVSGAEIILPAEADVILPVSEIRRLEGQLAQVEMRPRCD